MKKSFAASFAAETTTFTGRKRHGILYVPIGNVEKNMVFSRMTWKDHDEDVQPASLLEAPPPCFWPM